MEDLQRCKISLKDICKDITSKLNKGTTKVLILSPKEEEAEILLKELKRKERPRCEIKVSPPEKYSLRREKIKITRNLYLIDLYRIELIQ